jgi:hypothetical protein
LRDMYLKALDDYQAHLVTRKIDICSGNHTTRSGDQVTEVQVELPLPLGEVGVRVLVRLHRESVVADLLEVGHALLWWDAEAINFDSPMLPSSSFV